MNTHQLSIAFQTEKTPAEYIALAKLVDQYRFDVISVYCDLPYHPSFGPLLLMAPHIKEARIGPAAISPARFHPVDIAANSALLSQVAQGGIYVGLARGAWLEDFGINISGDPIQRIREAGTIIRNILSGIPAGFNGEIYKIAPHVTVPYSLPSEEIPILIGTWGPKLAGVAGEIGDEVKVGGSTNPDFGRFIRGSIQQGEMVAGRPKNSVGIVMGAVTVVDEDREIARKKAKEALALYFPVVANLDHTLAVEPGLIQRVRELTNAGDSKQAADQISDQLLDKFAFSGAPHDLIHQSEALFDAGVNRIEFGTPHGIPSVKGIKMIGEKVIPYLSEKWVRKGGDR
jgi:5,10-methylenetetrahydromethanopterin reductase